jgi:DNA-binding beta-propeller fold protein YncE
MHMTRHRFALLSLAAAMTAAIGACGAGGVATPTSAPSASASAEASPSHASPRPSPTLVPGVLATIRAHGPMLLAAAGDAIWVENHGSVLSQIDPAQNLEVAVLATVATHCDVTAGGGAVWASDAHVGVVSKVDPVSGAVLGTIELQTPCGLAADDADLWVASPMLRALLRYDASTLEQQASIELGDDPFWAAVGPEGVWAAGEAGDGVTYRVDPETNKAVAEITTPNPFSTGLEVGFGSAWVPARDEAVIYRIDPSTNAVVATIKLPSPIGGIGVGADAIWVGGWGDGTVYRIDPGTNEITGSLATGYGTLAAPVEAFGSVWVSAFDRNVVLRIDPAAIVG